MRVGVVNIAPFQIYSTALRGDVPSDVPLKGGSPSAAFVPRDRSVDAEIVLRVEVMGPCNWIMPDERKLYTTILPASRMKEKANTAKEQSTGNDRRRRAVRREGQEKWRGNRGSYPYDATPIRAARAQPVIS